MMDLLLDPLLIFKVRCYCPFSYKIQLPAPPSGVCAQGHLCSVSCKVIYSFFSFLVYTTPSVPGLTHAPAFGITAIVWYPLD